MCIGVSNRQGLVHSKVFDGGIITAERFSSFLEVSCGIEILADMNASGICIDDNAQPHI